MRKGLPMSKSSITTKAIATPNRVTAHPGEVLTEEFLKPLGMSINALAIALLENRFAMKNGSKSRLRE